jgi:hypothetical protein
MILLSLYIIGIHVVDSPADIGQKMFEVMKERGIH